MPVQTSYTVTVAIVSDTHAWLDPRIERAVSECDVAVHAGDICAGNILRSMQPKSGQVIAVAGNNDRQDTWLAVDAAVVNGLPKIAHLALPGGNLAIEHGDAHGMKQPCHISLRNTHATARAIVYGHTHRQFFDASDNPWIINPGAAGNTRTNGGPAYALLTASESSWDIQLHQLETLDSE